MASKRYRNGGEDVGDVAFFLSQGCGAEEAADLARAEAWLGEQNHEVDWEIDTDYDPTNYVVPGMPNVGYGCIVRVGDEQAWLWSITFTGDDFPEDDPYVRVVVAQLASELMP